MELADVRCGICGWTTGCECASRGFSPRPCDNITCWNLATGFDAWGYWCDEHDGDEAPA